MKKMIEFIKFSFVGGAMTLLSLGLFSAFVEFVKLNYLIASIISYIIVVILSYYLNLLFTFSEKITNVKKDINQLIQYFVMRLIMLVVDSILLYLFVDILNINIYVGKISLTVILLLATYPISKLIIVRKM